MKPPPSSSASPLSSSSKPNIWERLRRWWFDFEPSLPDDLRHRVHKDGAIDASAVDSVDNAFLAVCDDPAVVEFCEDAGIDIEEVEAEVRAAPIEAHVVERDVVAGIKAQARVRANRRKSSHALEVFLGCLREGPLARVAMEEHGAFSVVDVLWYACHGDGEDDGDRDGVFGEGDAGLVVDADDFTPRAFLLQVLRTELQCTASTAEEIARRLDHAPSTLINVAPAAFQRSVWQRVTEQAMVLGHPLRVRLVRP